MPAYDYRCTACNAVFELTCPVGTASADAECPTCDGIAKRVFTPVGVVFKGSGFHNTDYRTRPDEGTKPAEKTEPSTACPASKDSPACSSCPASSGDV